MRRCAHRFARPVARCLGAVAAGGHVAPASATVLGAVEEDASASRIAAASHPAKLSSDQRIGAVVDDGHHEGGESVAAGDEVSRVRPVGRQLEASCTGAPAQHSIDFRDRIGACITRRRAMFGQRAERSSNAPRVQQRCGRPSRLLLSSAEYRYAALVIDNTDRRQPLEHGTKIAQRIAAHTEFDIIGIDEIEPQAVANEDEGAAIGWSDDRS